MRVSHVPAIALLSFLAACSGGEDDGVQPSTVTLASITVPATLAVTAGGQQTINAQGIGDNGQPLSGVTFSFVSGTPSVAAVTSAGVVVGLTAGSSTVTVTGSRSGVSRTAPVTVTVTGTLGTAAGVTAGAASNTFTPALVAVARGGTVSWTFGALVHNVEFGGAAGAPTNIGNTSNNTVARTFANAGTFNYVCSLHAGMTGTVIVP